MIRRRWKQKNEKVLQVQKEETAVEESGSLFTLQKISFLSILTYHLKNHRDRPNVSGTNKVHLKCKSIILASQLAVCAFKKRKHSNKNAGCPPSLSFSAFQNRGGAGKLLWWQQSSDTLTIISATIAFTAQSPLSRDKVMLRFCCDSGIFLFPAMPG